MKSLIVANWKCNPLTFKEAKLLFNSVQKKIKNIKNVEVVICPPFIYLSGFKPQVLSFKIGAQDCFWEEKGAFTGEVSPKQLSNIGCQYVIIGHSERRRIFGETEEVINKKIKAVIKEQMIPILCVGETEEDKKRGQAQAILYKQIKSALKKISSYKLQASGLCIAYEPIWAIGTGNPCDSTTAQTMDLLIKKIIAQLYNRSIARKIPILYGGSVNSKNAPLYIKEARMAGLLVGGASLIPKEFIEIVKRVSRL